MVPSNSRVRNAACQKVAANRTNSMTFISDSAQIV